ncbi:MAG: methyltransferase domain-containing protein [Treponema sp.]|nr:methyltransferase domain-containing protein [Treponema sp.]
MTVVIVQCRLSSTRLPEKALRTVGGKPIVAWTLSAMRQVPADRYILAVDYGSYDRLFPVAASCGWDCCAGPLDDVLERFCRVVEAVHADTVVRATADNPFLFYEAATELLSRYQESDGGCDYISWRGLPHGSGVEIFNAHSLCTARTLTDIPFDREHVGPALYNHPERFTAVFVPAPERYRFPELRTTVDTERDYRRACAVGAVLLENGVRDRPATTEEIIGAFTVPHIAHPVLFVPSVERGHGTGHVRRAVSLAEKMHGTLYLPRDAARPEISGVVAAALADKRLADWQVTDAFPRDGEYALIVLDLFSASQETARAFSECAPTLAIDDGGGSSWFDYLLDIIPSLSARAANRTAPEFLPLPKNRHSVFPGGLQSVLVTFGGEDPAQLTVPVASAFSAAGCTVTAIVPFGSAIPDTADDVRYIQPVSELAEKLGAYDIVVTHYGFTAYEARAAGCAVVTVPSSPLHRRLSERFGFVCLKPRKNVSQQVQKLLHRRPDLLFHRASFAPDNDARESCAAFLTAVAAGRRLSCPLCGDSSQQTHPDVIVARTPLRTFRRCARCSLVYMAWTADGAQRTYESSYFAEEYRAQYGKTYLEDFSAIKAQGSRRMQIIAAGAAQCSTPTVLDVGCAYGPFLSAAQEIGWNAFGTDIASDAVAYVMDCLHIPAVVAPFPDIDTAVQFGIAAFDAVTMWYVIEHFSHLAPVLKKVSSVLRRGGIFAFGTPSGEGVSARKNRSDFFSHSPADHYTIWEPSRVQTVLARFGFTVRKIVSTGHHPERFPLIQNCTGAPPSLLFKACGVFSRMCRWGDTFEVYCEKTGEPL